ncbi:MAG TPA: TetR/AcrR family transcriptional regulator [Kofleriaceae bacterium]|nr:TetR/AcrR family transcriptional regulator [Kofleriaceae bacterium]
MPTGATRTTARGGELKRQAILEAALELFVERGFHGTSVPSVADKAGVGAGTIYRYFASKEALVNELFREHKQAVARHVLDGFPFGAPAREQFRVFFQRLTDYARSQPRAFAFLELHSHADYLDDESREVERQILDFALRFFETTQAKGEIKSLDPMLMIGVLFGAIVGMVKLSWEGKLQLTDARLEAAEQLCWEAIRA